MKVAVRKKETSKTTNADTHQWLLGECITTHDKVQQRQLLREYAPEEAYF